MKLMITIVHDSDSEPVSDALTSAGFRVTRIASTGGFLRRGSSTLMIGVEDEKVDQAIEIIRQGTALSQESEAKRAILFVLNVHHFIQL